MDPRGWGRCGHRRTGGERRVARVGPEGDGGKPDRDPGCAGSEAYSGIAGRDVCAAEFGPDYQKAFRAVFDKLGKRPGVLYDPFFLDDVAMHTELIQADGEHPNEDGVKREVARILPLVERLLAETHPA